MLKLLILILIYASASHLLYAQSSLGSQNYTAQYANTLVNNVSDYIATVNESSYLIFQPDLSGAYINLTFAM